MQRLLTCLFAASCLISTAQQKTDLTLHFDFGTINLTEHSNLEVPQFLNELKKGSVTRVIINGYTDKIGTSEYNNSLSYDRAAAIRDLFKTYLPQNVEMIINGHGFSDLISQK